MKSKFMVMTFIEQKKQNGWSKRLMSIANSNIIKIKKKILDIKLRSQPMPTIFCAVILKQLCLKIIVIFIMISLSI